MAKVTITIADTDGNRNLNLAITSDPPFPGPGVEGEDTVAQNLAGRILGLVGALMEDEPGPESDPQLETLREMLVAAKRRGDEALREGQALLERIAKLQAIAAAAKDRLETYDKGTECTGRGVSVEWAALRAALRDLTDEESH